MFLFGAAYLWSPMGTAVGCRIALSLDDTLHRGQHAIVCKSAAGPPKEEGKRQGCPTAGTRITRGLSEPRRARQWGNGCAKTGIAVRRFADKSHVGRRRVLYYANFC